MANVKITDLTAGTALGGSELFEAVQSSTSVKISATQVKNFIAESLALTAGSIPFNTITGRAIAQFESHVDQTATSANVAYTANMNNAASFNTGITIASSTNVTVAAAGVYSINTSIQFANSDTTNHTSTFWFRKNGTNIANSASIISVPKVADGGKTLAQVTIFESMSINDYVQLIWSASNTAVSLDYTAASGVVPEVPSIIFNMQRIA
jgi:hypothetical protein